MSKLDSLPPGIQVPVKASLIKQLIKSQNEAVDVSLHAWKHQRFWKEDRDLMAEKGQFGLIELYFSPDGSWNDDTPQVTCCLFGVPSELWKTSGSARDQLIQVLENHLKSVSAKKAWDAPWTIKVIWDTQNSKLEIHSHIGRGKREEEDIKQSVPIQKKI